MRFKKNKLKTVVCIGLAVACTMLSSCGKDNPIGKDYVEYPYTAKHESTSRLLSFYSSNDDIDAVLNEYLERHMRYNEETQIHNLPVGAGRSDWKEWEAMTGSFWNASAVDGTLPQHYATQNWVKTWLMNPNIDTQGYVMPDDGTGVSWGLGWEFPAPSMSYYFDNNASGWTAASPATFLTTSGSLLSATASMATEVAIESPVISQTALMAPYLFAKFKISISDKSVIDDLYVYYKTESDNEYSDSKSVKFSTFSPQGFSLAYGGSESMSVGYFPMYLQSGWGKGNEVITGVKFVLKAKADQWLSNVSLAFDEISFDYDDRHVLNGCNYIIAAKEMVAFSQDKSLLATVLPNARRAMNFMYYQLGGKDGLISTEYLVGHDNRGVVKGYGMGNGYWDISSFPDVNIYCNLSYYNALKDLIYLEQMAEYYELDVADVYTQNETMTGRYKYVLTAESLEDLRLLTKSEFESYFWNENTGRFFAGYRSTNNTKQDNGYLMFNQQAIVAGLGTEEQVESIMSWITGERKVTTDNSINDIYKYEFAPRFCTADMMRDAFDAIGAFGTNVNNGGTALHLAYYDLVSYAKTDINKAGARLDTFVAWFNKVKAAGGEGWNFYREYYNPLGISLQGNGSGGVIGLDYEFLEAALFIRAIPDAFFGLEPIENAALSVTPNLPDSLDFMKMENLTYGGNYYDLSVGHFFAEVSSVDAYPVGTPVSGLSLRFVFERPSFDFKVYINGSETNDYIIMDGNLYVTCDFENVKVEIKKV